MQRSRNWPIETARFVDVYTVLAGSPWLITKDDCHFNDVGQRLIGMTVFGKIATECSFIAHESRRMEAELGSTIRTTAVLTRCRTSSTPGANLRSTTEAESSSEILSKRGRSNVVWKSHAVDAGRSAYIRGEEHRFPIGRDAWMDVASLLAPAIAVVADDEGLESIVDACHARIQRGLAAIADDGDAVEVWVCLVFTACTRCSARRNAHP